MVSKGTAVLVSISIREVETGDECYCCGDTCFLEQHAVFIDGTRCQDMNFCGSCVEAVFEALEGI